MESEDGDNENECIRRWRTGRGCCNGYRELRPGRRRQTAERLDGDTDRNGSAQWAVVRDDTAPSKPNVLKQSGQATYPICLKDDTAIKDGFVEVKFKPLSGKEDQAGGLIWRAKDANNYYVARANALENNVTIYDTVNGRRVERKRARLTVAANQWHTLRVEFQGNQFSVTLNGQKALDWSDETFKDAGKVGVWTKADSVTRV